MLLHSDVKALAAIDLTFTTFWKQNFTPGWLKAVACNILVSIKTHTHSARSNHQLSGYWTIGSTSWATAPQTNKQMRIQLKRKSHCNNWGCPCANSGGLKMSYRCFWTVHSFHAHVSLFSFWRTQLCAFWRFSRGFFFIYFAVALSLSSSFTVKHFQTVLYREKSETETHTAIGK